MRGEVMLVSKLWTDTRALLDIYTENGAVMVDSEVADEQAKFIRFADMAQNELFSVGCLYNTYEFAHKPYTNLLGNLSNFDIVDHVGTDKYYPESGVAGAKAYYFEVDGSATVTIEELRGGSWVTIATPVISASSMTAYKGTLSPQSDTNLIRIKFAGNTHYRHRNRCLFSYPFSSVPDYKPWFKKTMPANFRILDAVVEEESNGEYHKSTNYRLEGLKDLYIDYSCEANFKVIYKPIPTQITAINSNLEIDDITAQAITYYCASRLAVFTNKELVQFYEDKYNELKAEMKFKKPTQTETIVDVY